MKAESPNLDVLRALAVLLVLFDHLVKFFGYERLGYIEVSWMGGFGVLLFFVHTCLVLMLSLERLQADGGSLFARFYIRRAFRIYPLSMLTVLTVVGFSIPASRIVSGGLVSYHPGTGEVIANLLLVQNLTAYRNHIIGVLWSLPMEIQMYVTLPFLFLLARRFGAKLLLGLWAAAIGVALIQPSISYRLDIAQFVPHFIPGVVAYALLSKWQPRINAAWWPAWLVALTAIFLILPGNEFGWFVCLTLGVSIPLFENLTWKPLTRAAHVVAKYSYGIYLGHLICIWAAFVARPAWPPVAQWGVFTLLIFALPAAMYHVIEHPFIKLGSSVAKRLCSGPAVVRVAPADASPS